MKKAGWLVAMGLLAVLALSLAPQEVSDLVAKSDQIQDQGGYLESNKILMEVLKADPNNQQVYWMIARNYYNLGELLPEAREKEKLDDYVKCEEWARKGAAKNPKVAENYFYVAVGMSSEALVKGIAKSLGLAKDIEAYYLKTLEMRPTYRTATDSTEANAHFALCQFYRKVPESVIMRILFGTKGDMDKAVEHCRASVKILPDRIDLDKEIGVTLLCRGNRRDQPKDIDEGKKWLQKAINDKVETEIDKIDKRDAKKVYDNPKLACGYSRVKQEEVTEVQK